MITLAMPLFFALVALVVDGSNLMVHKRSLQNAADASALAASQELPAAGNCDPTCRANVVAKIEDYSARNGGPAVLDGGPGGNPRCLLPSNTNCYTNPYRGNDQLLEVRLRVSVGGFFTSVIGLGNLFHVSARAVGSANPIVNTTVFPGTTYTDPDQTIPGGTHTSTDPDTNLGGNGVAFLMSRTCNAMTYNGAGSAGIPLGAFATNGGVDMSGNKPKKVASLFYNKPGCPNNPPSPPSGTSQCTALAWGDATELNDFCVKTLVDLNQNNTLPINWPLKIPTIPTMLPVGTTWNPSVHYPGNCINAGQNTINQAWANTHAPGVYCVSGAGTTLSFNGDFTGGDGYTFFALGGAKISLSANGTMMKFYWPSACGARSVVDLRPATFSCFSRTLWSNHDWDPQALLYSSFDSGDGTCSICLQGQNGNLTGDLLAPNPAAFPPTPGPTQNGALVFIGGGALAAGKGFIEAWNLNIRGNTGSYQGTGVPIIVPGGTHTTTDPDTVITGTVHSTPGSTNTTTVGTTIGLGE